MLQGQNKGRQGEGVRGGEGDNGGGLVASDSSGGGGAGDDDGEDNRIITKGQLGEADNDTFLLDSPPIQEAVPENCSEQLPRTSVSDVDSAIVKDDHLDEFVPGMNLPRNPNHPSLPDIKEKPPNPSSVDIIMPFFSLAGHEDNSLPDSQDDR